MSTTTQPRPLSPLYRWLVLVVMSLICFASYYIYDSITEIGTLIKQDLGFSGAQYGLLFSFYSVANVLFLMVLVAGVLVDKLGLRFSGILYGFLCLLGAVLTALGAWSGLPGLLGGAYDWLHTAFLPSWSTPLKVMLLGRMIYGVGAEAILVVNNKVLARWFKGKELAFAYGANLTIMRVGTFLALNLQAPLHAGFEKPEAPAGLLAAVPHAFRWVLYQFQLFVERTAGVTWDLRLALWFAAGIMALGFASFFIYLLLERVAANRTGAPACPSASVGDEVSTAAVWYLARLAVVMFAVVVVWLWVPGLAMRLVIAGPLVALLVFLAVHRVPEEFHFGAPVWYICLLCVTFYSAIFPFQAYAPDILVQKFRYSVDLAGGVTSLLTAGTMIFTPIFGFVVDRVGRRATLMILGALLLVPCHLLIGYTRLSPVVPIVLVGVSFSLVPAALWAAIPMMVPERRLGTAFGVVGYVQNVGLWAFPWLAGKIADAHTTVAPGGENVIDYAPTMLMFAGLATCGLLFSVLLKWADARRKDGTSIEKVLLT